MWEELQIISFLKNIMEQSYFQYSNPYIKPQKYVILGSTLSGILTELRVLAIKKLDCFYYSHTHNYRGPATFRPAKQNVNFLYICKKNGV